MAPGPEGVCMEVPQDILHNLLAGKLDIQALRRDAYSTVHSTIDYVKDPISYKEFFEKYLLANRACILGAWATESWRSRSDWKRDDGQPNLEMIKDTFGSVIGPVANCKKAEYGAQPKKDMTIADYINYLDDYRMQDYPSHMDCLYLKDWHFNRAFPSYGAYVTPTFFQSDWMNEFWDLRQDLEDDYRFVYIGPKGSWTPFHADVFHSYSWSANIAGCKKWIMFPPGEEEYFKDRFGQLAYDVTSSEITDTVRFPNYRTPDKQLEVIQKSGEVIFVPSGWHHQVYNMEDTISINHNWFNGCNIDLCWEYIKRCHEAVQREIADLKGMDMWDEQCQLILRASSGIDYSEFYMLLLAIAAKRILYLQNKDSVRPTVTTQEDNNENSRTGNDSTDEKSSLAKTYKVPCSEMQHLCTVEAEKGTENAMDSEGKSDGFPSQAAEEDTGAHCQVQQNIFGSVLVQNLVSLNNCENWTEAHALFDLIRIAAVLEDMVTIAIMERDWKPQLGPKELLTKVRSIIMKLHSNYKSGASNLE